MKCGAIDRTLSLVPTPINPEVAQRDAALDLLHAVGDRAVVLLDGAYRLLLGDDAFDTSPPSSRWHDLMIELERDKESSSASADQVGEPLLDAAAEFLTLEASDLRDQVAILAPGADHAERIDTYAAEIGALADVLLDNVDNGTWRDGSGSAIVSTGADRRAAESAATSSGSLRPGADDLESVRIVVAHCAVVEQAVQEIAQADAACVEELGISTTFARAELAVLNERRLDTVAASPERDGHPPSGLSIVAAVTYALLILEIPLLAVVLIGVLPYYTSTVWAVLVAVALAGGIVASQYVIGTSVGVDIVRTGASPWADDSAPRAMRIKLVVVCLAGLASGVAVAAGAAAVSTWMVGLLAGIVVAAAPWLVAMQIVAGPVRESAYRRRLRTTLGHRDNEIHRVFARARAELSAADIIIRSLKSTEPHSIRLHAMLDDRRNVANTHLSRALSRCLPPDGPLPTIYTPCGEASPEDRALDGARHED